MKVTFHWEEDPNHCSMCECCSKEDQARAEVLTCTVKINGEVMDSLSAICATTPDVMDEYRKDVEDDLREVAFTNWMKTLHRRGRILWAQI